MLLHCPSTCSKTAWQYASWKNTLKEDALPKINEDWSWRYRSMQVNRPVNNRFFTMYQRVFTPALETTKRATWFCSVPPNLQGRPRVLWLTWATWEDSTNTWSLPHLVNHTHQWIAPKPAFPPSPQNCRSFKCQKLFCWQLTQGVIIYTQGTHKSSKLTRQVALNVLITKD